MLSYVCGDSDTCNMEMMWRHGSQLPFRVNFNLKLSQKTSTATQLYNIPSFILLPNLKYRGEISPIYTIKLDCEGTTDDARCDVRLHTDTGTATTLSDHHSPGSTTNTAATYKYYYRRRRRLNNEPQVSFFPPPLEQEQESQQPQRSWWQRVKLVKTNSSTQWQCRWSQSCRRALKNIIILI